MDSYLNVRALPKLVTTTTSSILSKSTATLSKPKLAGSLPTLSSGASTTVSSLLSSLSSSTSSAIPTIVPPSADNNPYILGKSKHPDGTVFIAVGTLVGFIFLALLVRWVTLSVLSRRNAKRSSYEPTDRDFVYQQGSTNYENPFLLDEEKLSYDGGLLDEKLRKSQLNITGSHHHFNSITSKSIDSENQEECREYHQGGYITDDDDNFMGAVDHARFNPIQDHIPSYYNNRKSLFISPTLELKQNLDPNPLSNLNDPFRDGRNVSRISIATYNTVDDDVDDLLLRPERSASPERKPRQSPIREGYHKRNKSSLGMIANVGPSSLNVNIPENLDFTPTKKKGRKMAPSVYLEDILGGDETLE